MQYYFIFSILMASLLPLLRKRLFLPIYIGCLFFLSYLPDTGFDYGIYKQAYDNAYYSDNFPWFFTKSYLVSEPLYIWYTSAIGVLLPFGFNFFLQFNFSLCFLLLFVVYKKLKKNILVIMWVAFLPVVFPTIFYYSPRSSISFFCVFLGLIYVALLKRFLGYSFIFLGTSMHSQYLPMAITITLYDIQYFISRFLKEKKSREKFLKVINFLLLVSLFLLAIFAEDMISFLSLMLSFLPSGEFATFKLHYLADARVGYRLTSILSILILPYFMYNIMNIGRKMNIVFFLKDQDADQRLCSFLFVLLIFGAALNIAFFENPHIAGRLSRFSDYLGIGFVLPVYFMRFYGANFAFLVIIVLSILAPILYRSVYGII